MTHRRSGSMGPVDALLVICALFVSACSRSDPPDLAPAEQVSKSSPVDQQKTPSQATKTGSKKTDPAPRATPALTKEQLAQERERLDQTVWADEVLSQRYEASLVALWDALLAEDKRSQPDKWSVLQKLAVDELIVGQAQVTETLDWGIQLFRLATSPRTLDQEACRELISGLRRDGYRLVQSEWHHASFQPAGEQPAQSTVTMAMHIEHPATQLRIILRGPLRVTWSPDKDQRGNPIPEKIDATGLEMLTRKGKPAFEKILTVNPIKPQKPAGIHPLILYDLDGDGLSEIITAGCNRVYWNLGKGKFQQEEFCAVPYRAFEVGVMADMTGDGIVDYLVPGIRGDLLLYRGDKDGRFSTKPMGKARGGGPLQNPQALTVGDIDADGDLDVFLGQYKISYLSGNMPTPYYDANDGFPAFLLTNDGKGRLTPGTEEAGLAKKRNRRTYTASFVDLDDDGDLDLLVVSDFAGVDVYENDGKGYFHDRTTEWIDEPRLFGMSATFGDFDLDGRLDFFVAGMSSTTARRLEQLRLGRPDQAEIHMNRMRMAFGNRMYLRTDSGYRQPAFKDQVARTGWTWGMTALDFDNDGDQDIFTANGHSSGKSTKDHCTHFWCHDIYEVNAKEPSELSSLFKDVHKGYLDQTDSWDGYQKNALLMNRGGKGFTNIAFLLGIADQFDGRAVASDDLDGDGRVDLLVVEDRWNEGQILHVYRNQLETDNNWIGVRLREEGGGISPVGAKITVITASRKHIGRITTGEAIHAQQASTLHFGLGKTDRVAAIEVRWSNGKLVRRIENPAVNQYHDVRARK